MANASKLQTPRGSIARGADRPAGPRRNRAKVGATSPSAKERSRRKSPHVEIPAIVEPELATLVKGAPDGDEWLHEVKFDGYRMICHVDPQQVRFQARNKLDWTARLSELTASVRRPKLRQAIFDGEIVVFDEKGISRLERLHDALREAPDKIVYVIFDLLFLKGEDLRGLPLQERKEVLDSLKYPANRGPIRAAEHIVGNGGEFFDMARRHGLEGIVSKRRDRPYVSGRTGDWLKTRDHRHGDFVIGGFTDPGFEREDVGGLLVGYYDDHRDLHCAGRVGAGLTAENMGEVLARLTSLKMKESPFVDFPELRKRVRGTHWVRPEVLAQVEFGALTKDGRLREPRFQGLREDKSAQEATREVARAITS